MFSSCQVFAAKRTILTLKLVLCCIIYSKAQVNWFNRRVGKNILFYASSSAELKSGGFFFRVYYFKKVISKLLNSQVSFLLYWHKPFRTIFSIVIINIWNEFKMATLPLRNYMFLFLFRRIGLVWKKNKLFLLKL